MTFQIEVEREADGRWIAEVVDLPGVLAYGATQDEAQAKVQALALRVVAERLEQGEAGPQLLDISFRALAHREGRRIVLEPADESSSEFRASLGSVSGEIPRPRQAKLRQARNPFA